MGRFLARRFVTMILLVFGISVVSFIIIELPRGDFGWSYLNNQPVSELIWSRVGLTVLIAALSVTFTLVIGVVIGIYSAVHHYSVSASRIQGVPGHGHRLGCGDRRGEGAPDGA